MRFLTHTHDEPRPVYPFLDRCLPLYVQSNRARIRKEGEVLIVEDRGLCGDYCPEQWRG